MKGPRRVPYPYGERWPFLSSLEFSDFLQMKTRISVTEKY